jgi:hypothetical protein
LERTLSIIGWKASLREEPSVNGNPKWKGLDGDNQKGIMPKILETLAVGVFLLKRMEDFPELIFLSRPTAIFLETARKGNSLRRGSLCKDN